MAWKLRGALKPADDSVRPVGPAKELELHGTTGAGAVGVGFDALQ